ncbi:MAG: hypothetical protein ACJA1X_002330 [Bermanella sp.]|jgi:hypothetical protein
MLPCDDAETIDSYHQKVPHMTSAFEFVIYSLAITGCCLIIDSCIMAFLNRNPKNLHNAERSHYLLSIFSIVVYLIAYQADSETFRNIWMQVLFGLYLFDLSIIARDWRNLKPSYRTFYSVHHTASLGLFFIWYHTFIPFTDIMALGGLLWVSSDVWRWAEQYWRLSGRVSSHKLRDIVWYSERCHRIFAYCLYMWILDFSFNHTSEMVLLGSGILMDAIDTYFQHKARKAYKFKQQSILLENNTMPIDDEIIPAKKAA